MKKMRKSSFPSPSSERYFEDYVPGETHEFGWIDVERDEVISFGKRFDPHVFHTDPEGAKSTMYGGLIASGWHTASLMMRLYAENYLSPFSSIGSPGVDQLKWMLPVRPGDSLAIRVTVKDTKRSRSKPDRGVVHSFIEVVNRHHEVVMSMKAVNFVLCKDGTA